MHVANAAVVHIANSFVTASREMMKEIRRLKIVLDRIGLRARTEWIPSTVKRYADALSRRLPRGELRIRRSVRSSILDGIQGVKDALLYRPLGEAPVVDRKMVLK